MNKKIIVTTFFVVAAVGVWFFKDSFFSFSEGIVDFNDDRDTKQVVQLFKDDWTLLLDEYLQKRFSVEFMLKNRTSSQYQKLNDLTLKVWREKGDVVAFTAYYKKSLYTGRLLFLLVNKDYRKQGRAKKMIQYVIDDLVSQGCVRVDLITQSRNIPAQSLYEGIGFKQVGDEKHEHFSYSWYKNGA